MREQFENSLLQLEQAFAAEKVPQAFELVVYLLIGGVLALYIQYLYHRCSTSVSDTDSFTRVFPLLTLVTICVIAVVKSSLALSLGLMGALSVVRFRAAIKEPEELIYLFLCIGVGLCLGNQMPFFAFAIVITSTFFVVANHFRGKNRRQQNLLLTITGDADSHFMDLERGPLSEVEKVIPVASIQRFEIEDGEGQIRLVLRRATSQETTQMIANLRKKYPDCQFSFVNLDTSI